MYGLNSDFEKKNVAIYARVSTEHEAQLSALENQLDWYKPILAAKPDWTIVEQYIDEGITGTSAEKRPRFMQMIRDAKNKKFDMIITREVSRFARNTVDTLQYTRLLKEYGVEVYFLSDNIKTFDGDGELRLTIMATLAQDESRKTSIRVKAGQQTSMKNGVLYGNGNILGYDRVGKELIINKEQAETVRMIFDMYLSGMGCTKIAYELEQNGRPTSLGKEKWWPTCIMQVLKNSFYCGNIRYHKQFTPDFLKQKKIKNNGKLEYIDVKGNHTPIVTEEEFNKVQKIIKSRTKVINDKNGNVKRVGACKHKSAYGRLLVCKCGRKFSQITSNRKGRWPGVDYQCYSACNQGSKAERIKRGLSTENLCDSPYIPGWKLEMMAEKIFDRFIENSDTVVDTSYRILEEHIADQREVPDNSGVIEQKNVEYERLAKKK